MNASQSDSTEQSQVPVIDIQGLRSAHFEDRLAVAAALRAACTDKGFFYVVNHGISKTLIATAFERSKAFFDLPDEAKWRTNKMYSPCNRGYEPLRAQTLEANAPPDLKESYYIGVELPDDDPRVIAGKFNHGPNQWPDGVKDFRPVMTLYFSEMATLVKLLMRGLALSLGLEEQYFDDFCTDPVATLRLLHYPPQPANPQPDEKGCGAHTDFGSLTLLAQDDVGGLQIWDGAAGWIAAPPVPGAFVVNLGDLVSRWTNDRYRSTLHRVVNLSSCERYSIPFFFTGNPDYLVSCLPTCTSADQAPKYPPVTALAHLVECYKRTYG
jgi:isopenicillin N synthase-like dioxygenase